jgi:hypothetical protein
MDKENALNLIEAVIQAREQNVSIACNISDLAQCLNEFPDLFITRVTSQGHLLCWDVTKEGVKTIKKERPQIAEKIEKLKMEEKPYFFNFDDPKGNSHKIWVQTKKAVEENGMTILEGSFQKLYEQISTEQELNFIDEDHALDMMLDAQKMPESTPQEKEHKEKALARAKDILECLNQK